MIRVVEPEPRAEEPKLNCLPEPEPKLRIEAPAPFLYHRPEEIVQKKIMVAEEVFVYCYNYNSITEVKKGNFQGIL